MNRTKLAIGWLLVNAALLGNTQGLDLIQVVEPDGSYFGLGIPTSLAAYFPFVSEWNTIYRLDAKSKTPILSVDKEFTILKLDANPSKTKIAYAFGYPDLAYPAMFDIGANKSYLLEDILGDQGRSVGPHLIGDLYWMDDNTLVYSMYFVTVQATTPR